MSVPVHSKRVILTTGQVAKICRVAPRTVSKWFDSGKLKGFKLPGSSDRRIPRANLRKFLVEYGMSTDLIDFEESQVRVLLVTDCQIAAKHALDLNNDDNAYVVHVVKNAFEAGAYKAVPQFVLIDFVIGRGEAMHIARAMRGLIGEQRPATKFIAILGEDDSDPGAVCGPDTFDTAHKQPCNVAALIEGMFVEQGV